MLKPFFKVLALLLMLSLFSHPVLAEEKERKENPSNPLAATSNLDIRAQGFDLGDGFDRQIYGLEGATMLTPKLKLKFELHYWNTDVTGTSEQDWESLLIKPIYFISEGKTESFAYRTAVGLEWKIDFDNQSKGIGDGSDTLSPFLAIAMSVSEKTTIIPLAQQFFSYSGDKVSMTAVRLIAIHQLPKQMWLKLDASAAIDWEHDNALPTTAELQWGKMFSSKYGGYADGFVGIGTDRPYDYGLGLGARIVF